MDYFLGFDTSNYKTSIAVAGSDGTVVRDVRRFLNVKKGNRGLRQSEALFQHVMNIQDIAPQLMLDPDIRGNIRAVAVSSRPRPEEGSYMPVFNAGISAGRLAAELLGVPCYEFSHQEGHIEAVRRGSGLEQAERFVSFHFSGGTTEAVLTEDPGAQGEHARYTIVGGSRDLAFGQLLDRVGVSLGMEFPCGEEMDAIAVSSDAEPQKLPRIAAKDGFINISGIETCCQRLIGSTSREALIRGIFQEVTHAIEKMTNQIAEKYHVNQFLFAGGVSASRFVRSHLNCDTDIYFGDPHMSTDNAAGIALLGGKKYGRQTDHCITAE